MVYNNDVFARKIRECRNKSNLTQEQLAELCGVSRQAVAKWESGKSLPDVIILRQLAKIFAIRVERLLDLEDKLVEERESEALNYRIVNMALREALSYQDTDTAINKFLEFLGKSLCAERCYIFERSNSHKFIQNTYEWCASGICPQIDELQEIPINDLEAWFIKFREEGKVVIYNLEDIKDSDPVVYKWLKPQKIRSLLVLPLFGNKAFFGVDNPPLDSMLQTNTLLETVSHFLECFLKQRDMYNQLEFEIAKVKYWYQYTGIVRYDYDIETGSIEFLDNANECVDEEYRRSITTYDSLVQNLSSHQECKNKILYSGLDYVITSKQSTVIKIPFVTPDRGLRWYKVTICPYLNSKKVVTKIFGTIKDITEEEEYAERNKAITTYVPGGIHFCYLSEPIHMLYASDSLCAMVEYSRKEFEELVGNDYSLIVIDEDRERFEQYAIRASKTRGNITCRYRIRSKSGKIISVLETMYVKQEEDGNVYGYANIIDITELEKRIENSNNKRRKIEKTLYIDRLTGLGNKRALINSVERLTSDDEISVMTCKLNALNDDFSTVETKGVLELKETLCSYFPKDVVYRTGADEFVVLIRGIKAEIFEQRIESFYACQEVKNLASIGYAFGKGTSYQELLQKADTSMSDNFNRYLERHLG